jgi:hypothetical protein
MLLIRIVEFSWQTSNSERNNEILNKASLWNLPLDKNPSTMANRMSARSHDFLIWFDFQHSQSAFMAIHVWTHEFLILRCHTKIHEDALRFDWEKSSTVLRMLDYFLFFSASTTWKKDYKGNLVPPYLLPQYSKWLLRTNVKYAFFYCPELLHSEARNWELLPSSALHSLHRRFHFP